MDHLIAAIFAASGVNLVHCQQRRDITADISMGAFIP